MELPAAFRLWKKGQRSAFDFVNRGYRGAWLLADGSMITKEVPDYDGDYLGHRESYKQLRDLLAANSAVRLSAPNLIQIYFFPTTPEQREEIARLFEEWERQCESMTRLDEPIRLWWDLTPHGGAKEWYENYPQEGSIEGDGTVGQFLRDLEQFEAKLAKEQKKNERRSNRKCSGGVKTSRSRNTRRQAKRSRATA